MSARAAAKPDADALVGRTLGALRDAAARAMEAAYAPYSGFRVGAALLTSDAAIVAGCNVENASYPVGVCAERIALGSAVTMGHREFLALAIATDAVEPTPPCGLCRQALVEFAPDLVVLSITRSGREARWVLADLLPHAFTPQFLDHSRH